MEATMLLQILFFFFVSEEGREVGNRNCSDILLLNQAKDHRF